MKRHPYCQITIWEGETPGATQNIRFAQQSMKFCYVKSDCCYLNGKWKCGNGIISKFRHEPVVMEACLQIGCKAGEGHSDSDSLPLNNL